MKHTYYMSAYNACTVSPPFPKEGQGWFVIFIELTLFYTVFSGTSRIAYTVVAKNHVVLTLCKKHVSHVCDVYEKESWRT